MGQLTTGLSLFTWWCGKLENKMLPCHDVDRAFLAVDNTYAQYRIKLFRRNNKQTQQAHHHKKRHVAAVAQGKPVT
jgi:hypothetical protein